MDVVLRGYMQHLEILMRNSLFFFIVMTSSALTEKEKQKNVGVTVLVFVGFFTIKNPKISRFDILFQNITEKLVPETKLSLFCLVQ